ncbi:uncharacterized protein LOC116805698 [Drosophila grimshawi]|uniref:uncharacterized protein LOC116805698 n=1 Tax=Drosophila grimshawi TaxID=7222 RepID=UPI000C86E8C8|nr:uncharacterized protein LOC116805698 [Drosophila grimshawi]
MEMPNEQILNAFLQMREGQFPENRNEVLQQFREIRSRRLLIGAGDGFHNNILAWNENVPPFIILQVREPSRLWHFMPILIIISNLVFKYASNSFRIDVDTSFLLGISYSTHFSLMQCLFLFACFLLKIFKT